MKSKATVFMRVTLAILFFCGVFLALTSTSSVAAPDRRSDRCKKRCEETYNRRKWECKRLRGRDRERHRCEEEAKRERNNCKDRCR